MNISKDYHAKFITKLKNWYANNKRTLPWRESKNPYKIWLSEIILQQTRVAQGLNYYLKFIANYPSVIDLAKATEEEVLKDWQGLGYYSRARNLHKAAKYIAFELNGCFPSTYANIKELKGVGDYTAAAIASFAFDLPHAVVDGNVYRVLSRIFGIKTAIDSSTGKKDFSKLAAKLIDQKEPANYNQAIMEFGALQCVPKSPKCDNCPFIENCYAHNNKLIALLPIKDKKIKQKTRFLNYLIFEKESEIVINHRSKKGIWQNLYDFPMIESSKEIDKENLTQMNQFKKFVSKNKFSLMAESILIKHVLSHQILKAKFFHFKVADFTSFEGSELQIIKRQKLKELPIPKLIENYLNEETNFLSLLDT